MLFFEHIFYAKVGVTSPKYTVKIKTPHVHYPKDVKNYADMCKNNVNKNPRYQQKVKQTPQKPRNRTHKNNSIN